jgi:cytochrome c oxidase subunit 3
MNHRSLKVAIHGKQYPGQQHLFHLVTTSPWPLLTSLSALSMLIGVVMYMHSYSNGLFVAFTGLFSLVTCMSVWWRDVIREATYRGDHTSVVQVGLRYGMLLFILSEVCFFVAFFWAFFHSSLSPTVEIGSIWPPEGFITFNPWEVPFLNTVILLSSGATITAAHHFIVAGSRVAAISALEATLGFAVVFTALQAMEYLEAPFSISDGIYGSTFFMATGFHGFHVIIGTIMIAVMTLRLCHFHFTKQHHFGFEAAAWYWHFVDVVWLFLFVTIYWWGSLTI